VENTESHESDGDKKGRVAVQASVDGAEDVAAIELGGGQQIERCGEKADPGGAADRMKQERAGSDAGMEHGVDQAQQELRAKDEVDVLQVGEAGNNFCVQDAVDQGGNGENEADQGAGSADVEECAGGADGGADQNECAEGADEGWEGKEERIAGANVMVAAGEEMAEFVGEQDGEQREGEGEAGGQARGMLIEEFESADKFLDGSGFVLRVGDGELGARDEAGAEREQEKNTGEEQGFWGRARRDVGELELLRRDGAPIEVERNGGRRIFWEWSGHEMFGAMKVISTYKYNIDGKVRASAGGFAESIGWMI
jgi:hypothetical protein